MLTGLDLYDVDPKQNSVIGLAWVSGMCHPEYSCTINEGNNFESVYVIAHEMGHNLGMNHDGETSSGNTCDPNTNLMSPVLGPGKVTWSSCSNQEINNFLSNRFQKISQFLTNVSDKRAGRVTGLEPSTLRFESRRLYPLGHPTCLKCTFIAYIDFFCLENNSYWFFIERHEIKPNV